MIGVHPRRPVTRPAIRSPAGARLAAAFVVLAAFSSLLPAQTPTDEPTLPASPDGTPSVTTGTNPAGAPNAPSDNAASPLLPASSPLPPHPSVPDPTLLPGSTPPPSSPPPLPVPAQTGTPLSSGAADVAPAAGGAATTNVTDAARRFQYAFRLSTGVTYDDNVFLTANSASNNNSTLHGISRRDVYFFIEPAVSLGYGDFLTRATNYIEFDYNAEVLLYTKNTNQDTVEHFFNLQGAYHFAQITLTLSQGVQLLNSTDLNSENSGSLLGDAGTSPSTANSQVNLDASRRTGLNVFITHVDANYAFSDKTSFDLDGYFSAYDYETLISSDTISGDVYFNYSPTGKLTLGLGGTGGYTIQSDPAPNEFYEQINLRLNYAATTKLSAAGTAGVEFRQTSGISGTEVTPVFNFTLTYAPFDSTSLSLAASRSVDTSAVLTGENFDTTGFTFTVSQRFFQRANAHLSLGYTHSNYVYSGSGVSTNRIDDYYFVQPGLDYTIRDNISAGIFYIRRQNTSTLNGNSFSDNQIGARLSFSF